MQSGPVDHAASLPIQPISGQRKSQVCHMDPQLMGASRVRRQPEQGPSVTRGQRLIHREAACAVRPDAVPIGGPVLYKHRYHETTPEKDKYFAYRFEGELGIMDDLGAKDRSTTNIYAVTDDEETEDFSSTPTFS